MPRQASTHVDDPAAVGERLRAARRAAGLSQRQLAFDGCTPAYISRIEAGVRIPSLQILREFGRRLGVSADFLATGEEERPEEDPLAEAEFASRIGETDRAAELYAAALADTLSPRDTARAQAGLGDVRLREGDHRAAVGLLEEALSRGVLAPDEAAGAADRLGRAYAMLGEYEQAIALFGEWLDRATETGDEILRLRFSTLLANAHLDSGGLSRAEELLGSAIVLADKVADPLDRARIWWSQSRLHTARSQRDTAARYARMAIDTLEATEHVGFAAVAYQMLAHLANERGDGEEALSLLERGAPAVAASGNAFHEALFRLERARALLALGERDEAASTAMSTVAALRDASPVNAGRGYVLVADVYRELGEADRAIELYELAAETLPPAHRYRIEVLSKLGELLEAEGKQAEALEVLKRALAEQKRVRDEVA